MTKQEFAQLISVIHSAYQNEKLSSDERSINLWWNYLKDVDYKDASRSLHNHIKTNKFPPTIAELTAGNRKRSKFNNFLPRNYDIGKLERALLNAERRGGNGNREE